MNSRGGYSSALRRSESRNLQQQQILLRRKSAIDFDFAHYMLNEGCKGKASTVRLAEVLNVNRTRILAFKNKPAKPVELLFPEASTVQRMLLKIIDDFYLNLLDWGSSNVLAIGLGYTVYLWDATESSTTELLTVDEDTGPITSVSWAPDGHHIAVGLNNSEVQLWDYTHLTEFGTMDWNKHILSTGGMDGLIINNDLRIRNHIMETYKGHDQEVCGLKWSPSGQQLSSGGNDNLVHIWNISVASSNTSTQWFLRLENHTAAVRPVAYIKFWNTHTGACLNSVDTGSQVCSLLWNKNERELLSSHGYTENQLTLWKYPSMVKMVISLSPDGCTVASAAGDETLRFWTVFGTPELAKPAAKTNTEPFARWNRIR
ncbi:hypothetical protein MKX01_006420 [Papaver californicum]|nr:hypothetical protein MKX01_006420 [Papaver californicum]